MMGDVISFALTEGEKSCADSDGAEIVGEY